MGVSILCRLNNHPVKENRLTILELNLCEQMPYYKNFQITFASAIALLISRGDAGAGGLEPLFPELVSR
jgi:hypothetical protein